MYNKSASKLLHRQIVKFDGFRMNAFELPILRSLWFADLPIKFVRTNVTHVNYLFKKSMREIYGFIIYIWIIYMDLLFIIKG